MPRFFPFLPPGRILYGRKWRLDWRGKGGHPRGHFKLFDDILPSVLMLGVCP